MRFTASRDTILKELIAAERILPKKAAVSMLFNIMLTATDVLAISATDLDISLRTTCPIEGAKAGRVVVPGKKLKDLIGSLSRGEIEFAADKGSLQIKQGMAKFRVLCVDAEHFPNLPDPPPASVEIQTATLRALIQRTIMAISREESRYALQGALFSAGAGLSMVATDGHRLAHARSDGQYEPLLIIIPHQCLRELLTLLPENEAVLVGHDENHVSFAFKDSIFTSRLLAGRFPDYDPAIPKDSPHQVRLNAQSFKDAVTRARIVTDEQNHILKLALEPGRLTVSAQSAEIGEAATALDVEYAGPDMTIGLNADYLIDYLSIASGEFTLLFKNGESPILIEDIDHRHVIMPCRFPKA